MKGKGKQARGYVPGDAIGNWMRAFWGVPKLDPYNLPRRISHDVLRQFIYVVCYDHPLKPDSRQVRFFTCTELMDLAWEALKWPPISKNQDRVKTLLSAKRRLRNICHELGVKLKKAPVGRPSEKKETGKF
jgi:hypothetical protein